MSLSKSHFLHSVGQKRPQRGGLWPLDHVLEKERGRRKARRNPTNGPQLTSPLSSPMGRGPGARGTPGCLGTFLSYAAQLLTGARKSKPWTKRVNLGNAKLDGLLEIFVGSVGIYIFRRESFLFYSGTIYET